jgi:hypothetical protein
VLADARRLVATGWCQRTAARDAGGRSVMPDDPAATTWSATGAVIAAVRIRPQATKGETLRETPFVLAMDALATTVDAGPQSWNDRPERCQDDVLEAFRAAHRLLLTDEPDRS